MISVEQKAILQEALNALLPQINQSLTAHILDHHGDPLETSVSERRKVSKDVLGVEITNSDLSYTLGHICGMSSLMVNPIVVKDQREGPDGISYIDVMLDVSLSKDLTAKITGNITASITDLVKSINFTGDAKITGAKHSYPAVFSVKTTGEVLKVTGFRMGSTMSSTPLKLGSATARLSDMDIFERWHDAFETTVARYMNEKLGKIIIDSVLEMLQTIISDQVGK